MKLSSKFRDFPTPMQATAYELYGSWWMGKVPSFRFRPLGKLLGRYVAWKVRNRFQRIEQAKEFERITRLTHPEWWD